MKQSPFLLLLLLVSLAVSAQPTTIVTSQGTFKLTPPEECINSTCLNGIIRIAEMAGPALAADVAKAKSMTEQGDGEIKQLASDYAVAKAAYGQAKAPYDAKMADYMRDWEIHDAAVKVNNATKPENRSQAEVDRLNRSKAALDSRKAVLDGEYSSLLTQWNDLQSKKSDLLYKRNQLSVVTDKLNAALEQLKKCQEFGERALKVSKEKNMGSYKTANDFFGSLKIIPSIELLNGSLEKMKAWTNKSWD